MTLDGSRFVTRLPIRFSKSAFSVAFVLTLVMATLFATYFAPQSKAASSAFRLVRVATASRPIALLWDAQNGGPWVVQQDGYIKLLAGKPLTTVGVALDVSAEVATGGEQGLLGATFSRDASKLYINMTNAAGDTEIREYQWKDGVAVASTKRILLTIVQPYSNHNGGHLVVDRNGLLWIGTGDGGSGGDPENHAQDLNSLLGKMLRIDPTPDPISKRAYSIPSDNPFASGGGLPEIWAYGLRNPWRFDIDEVGRRLFIGDVGQDSIEEVDQVPLNAKAPNFGWRLREGSHAYKAETKPNGLIDPIAEYPHSKGCSIVGGVFYTGKTLKGLSNRFIYGDYCKGWVASVGQRPGSDANGAWVVSKTGLTLQNLSSFARDRAGEVWLTSTDGTIARLTGR